MSEDYTQTNNCIEQIKKRHESNFNLDYISDVGFLLSHIHTLEEKVRELQDEVQKWQRIRKPTHGPCCTCQRCGQFYDDCRCDLDETVDLLQQAESRIKELELRIAAIELPAQNYNKTLVRAEQAETRIKKLEDAINNTGCLLLKNSIGKSKEVETDLQDYRERNPLVEQLSERIKELETDLKLRDSHEEQPAK
jgi:uncharacterized coiled-coil protein SlyX